MIEDVAPLYGCHVALTGGTLYKHGPRKDVDIMFYRIRQVEQIDEAGLFGALGRLGVLRTTDHGWLTKATYLDLPVDLFFPESEERKLIEAEYPA